jgi:hypothetical protein
VLTYSFDFCRLVEASGGDVMTGTRASIETAAVLSDSEVGTGDSVAIAIRSSTGIEEVKEKTKEEIKAEKQEDQKKKKELAKYTTKCVKRVWGMHSTFDYMCYAGGKCI